MKKKVPDKLFKPLTGRDFRMALERSVHEFFQSKLCPECGLLICNHLGYFDDPKTGLVVRNYGKPT